MHGDHRRAADQVVGGGHGELVGPGHRDGEQVARAYVGGKFGLGEDVTGLAVPAHDGHRGQGLGGGPADEARRVPDAVQGGPWVVAHAAVDGHARRPGDRPAGFDDQAGHREFGGRAGRGELGVDPAGQGDRVQGGLAGAVGDAVAAAEVEFGQREPVLVTQPGQEADHAAHGGDVRLHAGDLRAQVAVQAGEFELRLVEYAGDGVLGMAVGDGQAELLVLGSGADLLVSAGADPGHHPDHHPLAAVGPEGGGQPGDLRGTVDHDPAHAQAQRGLQVVRRLGVAVQHDPLGREPGGDRQFQLTGRADVQAQALLGRPADHGPAQERLGRVQDFGIGKGLPVGAAALAHLALVEDVDRGAEAVRDLGQRHAGDGRIARARFGGGGGPDGEVGGGGGGDGGGGFVQGGHRVLPSVARSAGSGIARAAGTGAGADNVGSTVRAVTPSGAVSARSAGSERRIHC